MFTKESCDIRKCPENLKQFSETLKQTLSQTSFSEEERLTLE